MSRIFERKKPKGAITRCLRIKIYVAMLLCVACVTSVFGFDVDQDHNTEIDNWFIGASSGVKAVGGVLVLQRFKDSMYIVTRSFAWEHDDDSSGYERVVVPKGFVTDLTSVPRVLFSVLPRDGDYVYGAVAHDYLYWTQQRSQEEADSILNLIMSEFDINWLSRTSIHQAVKNWGNIAWKSNLELKSKNERRYLRRFPQDPKVKWVEWKKDIDNFHNELLTEEHGQEGPRISKK